MIVRIIKKTVIVTIARITAMVMKIGMVKAAHMKMIERNWLSK